MTAKAQKAQAPRGPVTPSKNCMRLVPPICSWQGGTGVAQWYYERDGVAHGPVDEAALGRLYGRNAVNDHAPVWPANAPDRRTVLGATNIDLPPRPASQAEAPETAAEP